MIYTLLKTATVGIGNGADIRFVSLAQPRGWLKVKIEHLLDQKEMVALWGDFSTALGMALRLDQLEFRTE